MKFPEYMRFEGLGQIGGDGPRCFYLIGEFRAPKQDEWYMSGAKPRAYKAYTDNITTAYQIVIPTHFAKRASGLVRGERVIL